LTLLNFFCRGAYAPGTGDELNFPFSANNFSYPMDEHFPILQMLNLLEGKKIQRGQYFYNN
jgi:hypothetical protein